MKMSPINVINPFNINNSKPKEMYMFNTKQMIGEIIAIKGTNLSWTWYFVNKPKENIPNNGPYV